jgi:zinc transport system substrate-binding protein
MWARLQRLLTEHPARWMIWEDRPAESIIARLAEMGVECALFDPCGNAPAEGDYLATQRRNADSLAAVFTPP